MCDFCNNSGNRLSTNFDKQTKESPNFDLLLFGNYNLRINSVATENIIALRTLPELRAESLKINFCPMCGRKLEK